MSIFALHNHAILYLYPHGNEQAKKYFSLSWMRVRMSYHIFNILVKLINGELTAKIRQKSFPETDWIDNVTNIFHIRSAVSVSTHVNTRKCLVYKVKCSMCEVIYIGNTQQTFNKRMDGHLFDLLRLLKSGQK